MDLEQKERPFNQPLFDNIKLKALDGYAYKFSIVFPMSEDGRGVIFDETYRAMLVDLLTNDFGGCSLNNDVTHPLMQGTYIDSSGNVCKGKHSQIYVYSLQSDEAKKYFNILKTQLETLGGEEEILIEMIPVNLM